MRNDTHDELDHVPSLSTREREDVFAGEPDDRPTYNARKVQKPAGRSGAGTGVLWVLVGALLIALGGLGWWSFQQISLMEQQLVATQESFARISEEAAGRIQDISGKVVATESSVTNGSEALKLRVKQLEGRLADLLKQQQNAASQQDKRLDQLAADLKAQQDASAQLDAAVKGVAGQQADLRTAQAKVDKLEAQLGGVSGDVAALKKQGNPKQDIERLEQDLLVLRSELDNRPAQSSASTAEFDAFRLQVTRNISALQAQVQNLQQQLNAR
jgi:chromosome segregation ATPase